MFVYMTGRLGLLQAVMNEFFPSTRGILFIYKGSMPCKNAQFFIIESERTVSASALQRIQGLPPRVAVAKYIPEITVYQSITQVFEYSFQLAR